MAPYGDRIRRAVELMVKYGMDAYSHQAGQHVYLTGDGVFVRMLW